MAFVYSQVEKERFGWLQDECMLFEFTEGQHEGKLIEVTASQVEQDINQDNVMDMIVVFVQARRVNELGETVKVGTSEIRCDLGRESIMQAAIASGDIDPVQHMAAKVTEVIEKTINLETAVGAFSFLPSMST